MDNYLVAIFLITVESGEDQLVRFLCNTLLYQTHLLHKIAFDWHSR